MKVFIDTSAFLAVFDADDANHGKAKEEWNKILVSQSTLISNNYVLVETFALIQRRFGIKAVIMFQNDILPVLHIEWVAEPVHNAGVSALLTASKRKLSLVDCVSFETMRNSGIKTVFAFDSHFREQGFRCIP